MDDISCIILHTSVLPLAPPPPEEAAGGAATIHRVPGPLARAAACNDEANELYLAWQLEQERNPSNHKPQVGGWVVQKESCFADSIPPHGLSALVCG